MKPYTVQAVIERKDTLIAEARMLLKANALEFAHNLIASGPEAAKRGKMEGIKATLESIGVLEPVKGQAPTFAVQVNLHGGPEPVSLAKVSVQSEGEQEQAQPEVSLIMGLMNTCNSVQDKDLPTPSVPQASDQERAR